MELLLAVILLGAACAVVYGLAHAWRVLVDDDLGALDWSDQQAEKAAKATIRYLGAPYEYAHRHASPQATTWEMQRAADAVIVAERERRIAAGKVAKFPRKVG